VNQLSRNPYAAPQASFEQKSPTGCTRDGKVLVVPRHSDLPERCVRCNAPAQMEKPRTFTWHHPAWYLFILVAVLVYVLIALMVQKKAKVAFGLCDSHRARLRNFKLAAWGIFALGLGLIVLAIGIDSSDAAVLMGTAGLLSLLIAGVIAGTGARILSVARVSAAEARLKGCGDAFLDSLPHH